MVLKCLSPLENFADTVFRQVICAIGKPDLMFTEFMNVDVFCTVGQQAIVRRIQFEEIERPLIIQLWGMQPENYITTIEYIHAHGIKPDGFDINMGCSVPKILRDGSGAGLIKIPNHAGKIIEAVQSSAKGVPVSVKTRLGFNQVDTENWCGFLLEHNLAMLIIHGRTAKQKYRIPADWQEIAKVVKLRDQISSNTKIIGNGDIKTIQDGEQRSAQTGTDGFMIGREITDHPWVFTGKTKQEVTRKERLDTFILHNQLYEKILSKEKPFHTQRKYAKVYLNNFPDARRVRRELTKCFDVLSTNCLLEEAKHWDSEG